jgi:hypothetical protein
MEASRAVNTQPISYLTEEQTDAVPLTPMDLEMIAGGAGILNYD